MGNTHPRVNIELEPDLPAHKAITRILQHLLPAMALNELGLRADTHTEFLHGFRVAIRRTRTALGQFREMLPQPAMVHFRREFF